MTKSEKDLYDFYMYDDLKNLQKEIRKSNQYIKYHPKTFRYPQGEIDFNVQVGRLKMLNDIYELRSNTLSIV